jgi:hypothetical protein
MTDTIKTVDLANNVLLSDRDMQDFLGIDSLDVNQVSGEILTTSSDANAVTIYPQSLYSANASQTFRLFGVAGSLSQPKDAKFDYVRRKMWIADTGNDRVLKASTDKTNDVEVVVDDIFYRPFAIAANVNTGGCFVRAFSDIEEETALVIRLSSNGEEVVRYEYENVGVGDSSSSSSLGGSLSSSSSSGDLIVTPQSNTIAYDHVRHRVWWLHDRRIYMADQRNKQVQVLTLSSTYSGAYAIDVEFETGNAFVTTVDLVHGDSFLLQISRDNDSILGRAYINA